MSDSNSKTFQEIDNVSELAKNIETLKLPNQMASALASPILQHYISLSPNSKKNPFLIYL